MIETSNMSIPIRNAKDMFDKTCDTIGKIENQLNFQLSKVEFKTKIPYYQEMVHFYVPRYFKLEDYSVTIKDKELNLELKLILGVLTVTHDNLSELKSVFNRLLAF